MEDYKGITGDYADANHDGKVDYVEYDSDCYDFNKCYKNNHRSGMYSNKSGGVYNWIRNMTGTHWIIIILLFLQFKIPFLIIPIAILFILWICLS